MNKIISISLAAVFSLPVWAADKVLLEVPITLADGSGINKKVKRECAIEKDLEEDIGALLAKRNSDGSSLLLPGMDHAGIKVLQVQISLVAGMGGGGVTGHKALTIRAALLENGKVMQSKRFSKTTRGGFWGPLRDTCSIFSYASGELAASAVSWAYEEQALPNKAVKPTDKVEESPAAGAIQDSTAS
ncbi:hypothetical protein [Chitinimonas sp. JJ19]|uniref:hypothetical protein n=1 Tax=Chitinimonas sp. JJ19 TaxID=3109352 RepID=UPI003001873A